jgi:hypothetical protein
MRELGVKILPHVLRTFFTQRIFNSLFISSYLLQQLLCIARVSFLNVIIYILKNETFCLICQEFIQLKYFNLFIYIDIQILSTCFPVLLIGPIVVVFYAKKLTISGVKIEHHAEKSHSILFKGTGTRL